MLFRKTTTATPFFVLLVAVVGGEALAGTVRGRIAGQEKLTPAVYAEAAKPESHRFTWREWSPTAKAEMKSLPANPSRDICIAAIAQGTPPPHEPILVRITGGHTAPTTIVVAPGTRLSFENRDPFEHKLYQLQNPAWKADTIPVGGRREWSSPNPGTFEFRDDSSPSLRFYVVVEAQVVDIAYPAKDGSFGFNLPAGDYVLKAFFNGKAVGKPVSVAAKERGQVEIKESLAVGADAP
ncbi:MAG: hypothetical protein U0169_13235 [Polyangiaceae bacterium]